jgi:hypothetical protein
MLGFGKKKKFGRQDLKYLHRYYSTTCLHHISFQILSSSQQDYRVGGTYGHDISYLPTRPRGLTDPVSMR